MSVITLPAALGLAKMSWAQQRNDVEFRSPFGAQAVEGGSPLWVVTLQPPTMKEVDAGPWKSLIMRLAGRTNQLELWDAQRPAPLGTMRGTMTLAAAAAAGARSLTIISAGQAGATLKEGDLLGFGAGTTTQQVVMVTADAVADGTGTIVVATEPPLRNAFALGAAVVWDKPKALFRRKNSSAKWDYAPSKFTTGFGLDLIEDWRT